MVEQFSNAISEGSALSFVLAFVGGILASLTPCIYPVLPITVSFFSGRAKSHMHAIWLSLSYVFGMAIVYTLLGLFAALTGKVFGRITMNPFIYFSVGGIIVFFGMMQLGWVPFRLPQFSNRLNIGTASGRGSAFAMGLTSGLIVAPCTVPILGVILTYIASQQAIFFGAAIMFTFALGLGMLLMLLGIFTGFITRLPRSGQWLLILEKATGIVFICIGIYFFYKGILFFSI